MNITIPKQAANIIKTILSSGFEAYAVGGCVRDSILGKQPCDWDITTSARPEQIKALFPRTIDTGIKHGTVTILMGKETYEVTTYRIDGIYEDHRRPVDVTFTTDLKEDLLRRDFTINAMAYNDVDGLIDYFGGMEDLADKTIRCVGDATDRFNEDALRMLRAIRFAGQLGFSVEEKTRQAIEDCHENLKDVSAERIRTELLNLLISDHPEVIEQAYTTGLTGVFLPEFDRMMTTTQHNPNHCYTVGEHTIRSVCLIEPNPVLRLTMLLHDVGKPAAKTTDNNGIDHFYRHFKTGEDMSREILKRLKFDNKTIHIVSQLISHHDIRFKNSMTSGRAHVRKVMHSVGPNLFPYLLKVMGADVRAQSEYCRTRKLTALKETEEAYHDILKKNECLSLKELKINGSQLKALGIREGAVIGSILKALLSMVLEYPERNEYTYLEELALKIYHSEWRDKSMV